MQDSNFNNVSAVKSATVVELIEELRLVECLLDEAILMLRSVVEYGAVNPGVLIRARGFVAQFEIDMPVDEVM